MAEPLLERYNFQRSDGRAPSPHAALSAVSGHPPLASRTGLPLRLPGSQSGCKRIPATISHTSTEAISCTGTRAISASTPQALRIWPSRDAVILTKASNATM
ncbi:uncharacterized protein LOC120663354 [Panicum virgatum]|uniref:Uncharacterized protein n=1 Tax=Panicum virgatum TaxID=38727 RepID=A0A8T0U7Y9_PANVG|nr:uncharacterized protein LOC120663354 [Panicum virgatum]KAG2620812.1 hypothetical protein PVAP13_3NG195500 [Panicum virgatum]